MDYVEGKDLRATWNRCAKKGIAFPVDVAAYIVEGAGARAALRPQLRRHQAGAPRRLSAQRAAVVQRRGEADRLRAGLVDAEAGEDGARDHLRQGQLHVARAGARRAAGRARPTSTPSGIILWELLTGRQLFPSGKSPGAPKDMQTSEELLRRVRNPEMVPPSRSGPRACPPELDRIALKALAPELKRPLRELRGAAPRPGRRSWPDRRRHRQRARRDVPRGPLRGGHRQRAAEREELIAEARDWYASGASAVSAPLAVPVGPSQPRDRAPRSQRESRPGRTERGTMIRARRGTTARSTSAATRPTAALDSDEARRTHDGRRTDDEPSTSVIGSVVGGRYYVRKRLRRGRDGPRLRGRAHRHRPARGAEDPPPGLQPDARSGRAPAARGPRGLEDLAPQRRRRHRLGHDARRRRSSS